MKIFSPSAPSARSTLHANLCAGLTRTLTASLLFSFVAVTHLPPTVAQAANDGGPVTQSQQATAPSSVTWQNFMQVSQPASNNTEVEPAPVDQNPIGGKLPPAPKDDTCPPPGDDKGGSWVNGDNSVATKLHTILKTIGSRGLVLETKRGCGG